MARSYGALKTQIWEPGSDFRLLEPMEQWCYAMLISQPQINNLGVLPYTPEKWWRLAAGLTPETIENLIAALQADRYVIADHDTGELLIRTFVKHDKVWQQPKLVTNARRLIREVESATIRDYLTGRHPWLTNDWQKTQIEHHETTQQTPTERGINKPDNETAPTQPFTPTETPTDTHIPPRAPAGSGPGLGRSTSLALGNKALKAATHTQDPQTPGTSGDDPAREPQPESLPAALDDLLNRLGISGGLRVKAVSDPVRALACAQAALARAVRSPGGLFKTLLESGETPAVIVQVPRVPPCASCGLGGGHHLPDCEALVAA